MLSDGKFWRRMNMGLVILFWLTLLVFWQLPDSRLRVVFCDVGQGDAVLVTWKNYQMLVDGGPDNSVLSCLGKNMAFWDREIELVMLTHPQADHMTGLIEVLERYEVGQLVAANVMNETPEYWQLRKVVLEKGVKVRELVEGDELRVGPVELAVLWPRERGGEPLAWKKAGERQVLGAGTYKGDVNEMSLVLKGSFGQFDFLLTGDVGEKEELELVNQRRLSEVELLKVAHHGSRYSSSQVFLRQVSPEVAVVSVGGRNRFGHPTEAVLDRLVEVGAKVVRTDEKGMVRIVSDGESWWQD